MSHCSAFTTVSDDLVSYEHRVVALHKGLVEGENMLETTLVRIEGNLTHSADENFNLAVRNELSQKLRMVRQSH